MTKKNKNILENLNSEQKRAVIYDKGPLLIIAGAGTGKTTVITRRIAWLILEKQINTDEILALTFTEKAAQEMEEREDKLLPYGYVDLSIFTFHSFCEKVLQKHGLDIGLPINFKLLDSVQQTFLILDNFDRFDLDYYRPRGNPTKFVKELVKHFSRLKDELIKPKDYLDYAKELKLNNDSSTSDDLIDSEAARIEEVANAYHTYQKLLLENNALDFGDVINYTIELLQKRPQILKEYRDQFKYILVDEFQDTNWAQYKLIQLLAAPENNLTVVSDDDQSIYRWRGAAYNNVLQFIKDYKNLKRIVLVKNYRSGQNILDKAYKFIQQNNPARLEAQVKEIQKKLKSAKDEKGKVKYLNFSNQYQEAGGVIEKIIKMKKNDPNLSWNDFAILVRANSQAKNFCNMLKNADVPFQFLASSGLFKKTVIINILSYLRILVDYHDSVSFYKILSSCIFSDQINIEDLININYYAKKKSISLHQALKNHSQIKSISESTRKVIENILGLIKKHSQLANQEPVSRVIYSFLQDSGYLKKISSGAKDDKREDIQSLSYINQFFKYVEKFESLEDNASISGFLNMIDLMSETGDTGSLEDLVEGPDSVSVTTIHGAKGLEWKNVFVVGLVKRRFPTIRRKPVIEIPDKLGNEIIPEGDVHLQEERRLFYVAMTRAKDNLFLTAAKDYGGKREKKPSRFLHELNFVDKKTKQVKLKNDYLAKQKSFVDNKDKNEKVKPFIPKRFSFSQYQAFQTCPLQYKFNFLLNIPIKGKHTFSFGTTIHKTLEKFVNNWQKIKKSKQGNIFSQKEKKSKPLIDIKDLLAIYEKEWIDDWYKNKRLKQEYRQKGREMLRSFYKRFIKEQPNIIGVEKNFNVKVGKYNIKGKIDRVDKTKQGLELIDYKTGKAPKSDKVPKRKKTQLLLYQLAAQNLSVFKDYKISKLSYYYLADNKKLSFLGKDKELQNIKEDFVKTIDKINKSNFPPKPGRMCEWCDFKNICKYAYKK
ncbi:MAG TPA: UvrD-helicase domain-containing protein [Patescibacteria group bacterium]|nr:UvrD-helicase domain-containing protein [Patescibacteria group bacterium]